MRRTAERSGTTNWCQLCHDGHVLEPADISPETYEILLRDLENELGLEPGSVTSPEVGLDLGARYFAAVSRRPAPEAARLAAAVAERLTEVLDASEFTLSANDEVLTIRGDGGSLVAMIGFPLRLPLPPDERLGLAFRMWARDIAEFVTEIRGKPWPAPRAERHVSVDADAVQVFWQVPGHEEPVLALRPFSRAELGV